LLPNDKRIYYFIGILPIGKIHEVRFSYFAPHGASRILRTRYAMQCCLSINYCQLSK